LQKEIDMLGIFVLGMAGLWLWFTFWLGRVISKSLLEESRSGRSSSASIIRYFAHGLITVLVLVLPFIDQLLAYPKWQQLCSTTSDIEWAENINKEQVSGKTLVEILEEHETIIFPRLHVRYNSIKFEDVETGEIVAVMPHVSFHRPKSFFELPSAAGGGAGAIFLDSCSTSSKGKVVIRFLEKNKLTVIGYKDGEKLIKFYRSKP